MGTHRAFHYWRRGRRLGSAALVLAAGYVATWLWWDVSVDTYLLGQYYGVTVSVMQVSPAVFGTAALALTAPDMPRMELLCGRRTHDLTAAFMAVVALCASCMVPAVRLLLDVAPVRWIPGAGDAGRRPFAPATWELLALMWMPCALTMAVAVIGVTVCGRLAGGGIVLVWLALLLVVASWKPVSRLSPFMWDSSVRGDGMPAAMAAVFLAACVLQWQCLRRGWTLAGRYAPFSAVR
ncbi:hypothetical protein G1C96_1761 [Bifidobacterium sp. DSM 109958]|uniref:Uncharacterized protein n=1 Tax=Bifidobacterium moraviense TaxID=2675323 RepID=A0A7Y0HYD5_9BIFI|nr:hypothetical protein [Bifidobacterium sp. DSM 109958]NMN01176.1 hypothetical protein [Bifidobacterium sp. DSM 109958]